MPMKCDDLTQIRAAGKPTFGWAFRMSKMTTDIETSRPNDGCLNSN